MGGFTIVSPDYSPFPVNAEQLFYLVKHGHVDFPDITKSQINALSKTDTLSRFVPPAQLFLPPGGANHSLPDSLPFGRRSGSLFPNCNASRKACLLPPSS